MQEGPRRRGLRQPERGPGPRRRHADRLGETGAVDLVAREFEHDGVVGLDEVAAEASGAPVEPDLPNAIGHRRELGAEDRRGVLPDAAELLGPLSDVDGPVDQQPATEQPGHLRGEAAQEQDRAEDSPSGSATG